MWQSSLCTNHVLKEKKSLLRCCSATALLWVSWHQDPELPLLPPAWLDLGKGSFGGNLGAGRAEQWDRGTWH